MDIIEQLKSTEDYAYFVKKERMDAIKGLLMIAGFFIVWIVVFFILPDDEIKNTTEIKILFYAFPIICLSVLFLLVKQLFIDGLESKNVSVTTIRDMRNCDIDYEFMVFTNKEYWAKGNKKKYKKIPQTDDIIFASYEEAMQIITDITGHFIGEEVFVFTLDGANYLIASR